MIPLEKADDLARRVVDQLRPLCRRIEVAGDIRRRREQVVGLVLVIDAAMRTGIDDRVAQSCHVQLRTAHRLIAITRKGECPFEIFYSQTPAAVHDLFDPAKFARDNFGSLLLHLTGGNPHNAALCQRAARLGMRWNFQQGLYRHGRWVAGETEAQIYDALGLPFREPTDRELNQPGDIYRLVNAGIVPPLAGRDQ